VKRMADWDSILKECDRFSLLKMEGFEFMQFTGVNDNSGKGIYEGDILAQDCKMVDDYSGKESNEVQKLVVRWSTEKAAWSVYAPDAVSKKDWGYIPRGAAVIGNIYENPELINQ
jgi:uncharacterized phage protein (TIGR01671 family)